MRRRLAAAAAGMLAFVMVCAGAFLVALWLYNNW